jgi:hypothetical protein
VRHLLLEIVFQHDANDWNEINNEENGSLGFPRRKVKQDELLD